MDDSHDLTAQSLSPIRGTLAQQSRVRPRRKRGRIAKACSQCHSRKQKCDGLRPCRNCIVREVPDLCRLPASHDTIPQAPRPEQDTPHPGPQRLQEQVRRQTPPSGNRETEELAHDTIATSRDTVSQVGRLWKSRGAPSFFGSSYFGPQVAAALLDTPAPYVQPGANTSRRSSTARPFRDEAGPFSQLWDLLGLLPRQKSTVDRLVDRFLNEVSWHIDAVHPPSFRQEYERFYSRKAGLDDVTTVDIRWLALLFIILAIGAYLDCPRDARPEVQREYEDSSMSFFWACRKAVVIAPSFYGESTDLVRAGILVTRYCLFSQRVTESWLTVGFAARLAMAQGIHIDGTHWKLPRRITESRRRLWCHLYLLDRMISLVLGRPYCILDSLSLAHEPENVFLDDLSDTEANAAQAKPINTNPTTSVLAIFSYRLAKVIGRIQEQTFGMRAASYQQVMVLDAQLIAWKQSLPAYLAIDQPDLSQDQAHTFLKWSRLYLRTAFHFASIALHRPFIWRSSITDQHRYSREVCFASACADLKTRLEHDDNCDSTEHYTWCLGTPQLFNSAIVLGLLAIQEQSRGTRDVSAVINDLQCFCDRENNEIWANDFRLAEVKVVELCIERLKRRSKARDAEPTRAQPSFVEHPREHRRDKPTGQTRTDHPTQQPTDLRAPTLGSAASLGEFTQQPWQPPLEDQSLSPWDHDTAWGEPGPDYTMFLRPNEEFAEAFSFPGPTDLATWQGMIDAIGRGSEDSILGSR